MNVCNNERASALAAAADAGQVEAVKVLLQAGAKWDLRDVNNSTALHVACEKGHEQVWDMTAICESAL